MAVTDQVRRIKSAKAALKESIENKGVVVGDGTIDTYAAKVDAIPTGVTPTGTIRITQNGLHNVTNYANADVDVQGIVPTGTINISSNDTYDVTQYAEAVVNVPQGGSSCNIEIGEQLPLEVPEEDGHIFIIANQETEKPIATIVPSNTLTTSITKRHVADGGQVDPSAPYTEVYTHNASYIGYTTDTVTGKNKHYYFVHKMFNDYSHQLSICEFDVATKTLNEDVYIFNIQYDPTQHDERCTACIQNGSLYVINVVGVQVNLEIDLSTFTATSIAPCPFYDIHQYGAPVQPVVTGQHTFMTFSGSHVYTYESDNDNWREAGLDPSSYDDCYSAEPIYISGDSVYYKEYDYNNNKLYIGRFDISYNHYERVREYYNQDVFIAGEQYSQEERVYGYTPEGNCIFHIWPYDTSENSGMISVPLVHSTNWSTLSFADSQKDFYIMDENMGLYQIHIEAEQYISIEDVTEQPTYPYNIAIDLYGWGVSASIQPYDDFYLTAMNVLYIDSNPISSDENAFANDYAYVSQNGQWVLFTDLHELPDPPDVSSYYVESGYYPDRTGAEYQVRLGISEPFSLSYYGDVTLTVNGTTMSPSGGSSGYDGVEPNVNYWAEFWFPGQKTFTGTTTGTLEIPEGTFIDLSGRVRNNDISYNLPIVDYSPVPEVSSVTADYDEARTEKLLLEINWNEPIVAGSRYNSSYTPHEVWIYEVVNGAITNNNCELTAVGISNTVTAYTINGSKPAWLVDGTTVAVTINADTVRDATDSTLRNRVVTTDDMLTTTISDITSYYNVSFDSNGGSPSYASQTVRYGNTATNPGSPTKTGYTFNYWTLNGSQYNFSTPVGHDMILVASWTPINYTVSFDSNGGSSVNPQTVAYGNTASQPANPTKAHYTFNYWMLNNVQYNFNTPVTGNITLVAKWTENAPVQPSGTPYNYEAIKSFSDGTEIQAYVSYSTRMNGNDSQVYANCHIRVKPGWFYKWAINCTVQVQGVTVGTVSKTARENGYPSNNYSWDWEFGNEWKTVSPNSSHQGTLSISYSDGNGVSVNPSTTINLAYRP